MHVGSIDKATSPLDGASGIYVQGKYAYVASALNNSVVILDVSEPSNPVEVGSIIDDATTFLMGAKDIVVKGEYAYVVSELESALEILDISDPSNPSHVGSIVDNVSIQLGTPQRIFISGRYAYITSIEGFEIIDVSDPANPIHMGGIEDDNTTDLGFSFGIYVRGNYAYVCSFNENRFLVINISDPANPVIEATRAESSPTGIYINEPFAYIKSINGVTIYNVSDPSNPMVVGSITDDLTTLLTGTGDIIVSGKYAYVTSAGNDGVEVLDISDPTNPQSVGRIADDINTLLDWPFDMDISGNYLFVTSLNDDGVEILNIGRSELHTADIGNLSTNEIDVDENAIIGDHLSVGSGLNVGANGILSNGPVAVQGDFYASGNAGIGINDPEALLDLNLNQTGESSGVKLKNGNFQSHMYHNAAGDLIIRKGNSPDHLVLIGGKVGVSRVPVTNELEVEGDASKTTASGWAANSDLRIKTDVQSIENSLETLLSLRPVKFKYKNSWQELHPSIKDQYYYNFIAQEFAEVFPESVKGSGEYLKNDDEEILQIDTYNAQIVTISAVQELIKQNQDLLRRVEDLEKQVKNLQSSEISIGDND